MRYLLSILVCLFAALPAVAQDAASFRIGADTFLAGQEVTLSDTGRDDAFMAGETVRLDSDLSGSAHMIGRWVTVAGAVADLYAAGQEVAVTGDVSGDASLFGQEVTVSASVGGDLRVGGSELRLSAPVAGYAVIGGESVQLDAEIAGDAAVSARHLDFGHEARVEGILTLYETEPGTLEVPESVVPADRLERRQIEEWEGDMPVQPFSIWSAITGFVLGVIVIALLAALIAALAPRPMAAMRKRVLETPGRALLLGFVAISALIGAGIVLAMTLIGLLLSPAAFLLAVLTGFLGYVIGAYALGVWLVKLAGRGVPDSTADRAIAAGIGALVAGLLGLVPFLGWLWVLALVLAGSGAIATGLFRPRFFTEP